MKRQDIHRPSVIKPEDYDFVAIVSHDDEDGMLNMAERVLLAQHIKQSGGKFSQHAHGGSCHICGAHAFTIAYFHHHPSNQYICTGQDRCAKPEAGPDKAVQSAKLLWNRYSGQPRQSVIIAGETAI